MGFFNRLWTQPTIPRDRRELIAGGAMRAGEPRVVLALGGGGARGAAHLGAMRAIRESRLDVRRIVGVSIGSLIGAMCAVEPNVHKVQQRAVEVLRSKRFSDKQKLLGGAAHRHASSVDTGLFSWYRRMRQYLATHRKLSRAVTEASLLDADLISEAIHCLLPNIDIRECATPLSIVAADLRSGHKVVLESGSLRTAVQASMAIPGIFPPVEDRGMLLCDIGTIDSLPIDIAKSYPHDLSIAVDVSQVPAIVPDCTTALDVMVRMEEIGERMMRGRILPDADLVIRPHVSRIEWFDFHHVELLIEAGYRAARESLRRLRHHAAVPV